MSEKKTKKVEIPLPKGVSLRKEQSDSCNSQNRFCCVMEQNGEKQLICLKLLLRKSEDKDVKYEFFELSECSRSKSGKGIKITESEGKVE